MRNSTASEDTAIGSLDRQLLRQLWISDGAGSLVDMTGYRNTDWVGDITIAETVEQYIRTMKVQLKRETVAVSTHLAADTAAGSPNVDVDDASDFEAGDTIHVGSTTDLTIDSISPGGGSGGSDRIVCTTNVGAVESEDSAVVLQLSLAPLMSGDPALIDAGRQIVCKVAVIPQGSTVDDTTTYFWREIFNGYTDAGSWGGDASVLELPCRGQGGVLKDRFITTLRTYGSDPPGTAIATVLQNLVDDNLTSPPTITVSGTPNFGIYTYNQQRVDLASALQGVAANQAGDLRYRWDDTDEAWELTYTILDRNKTTPDVTYTSDDYYSVPSFVVDTKGVRNEVVGIYDRDAAGNESTVTAQDTASIAEFRRRSMVLDFTADPQITTAGEAQAVIDLAIQDLAQPIAQQQVALALDWRLQMHDLVRWTANNVHYKDDQDQAITGLRHMIPGDPKRPATTVVDCRGQPAGQVTRWIQKEAARRTRDQIEATGISVPPSVSNIPRTKVEATRVGSNARVDFTIDDPALTMEALRYKRRRSTDQGVDPSWLTTWAAQTGTIGTSEELTRTVSMDKTFTALIWEARFRNVDGVVDTIGDEIDLSTIQVIEKSIGIQGVDLNPTSDSTTWNRNYSTGELDPNAFGGSAQRYMAAIALPPGVTITEMTTVATRANSNSTAIVSLDVDEAFLTTLLTTLATNTHGTGTRTEVTSTLNRVTETDDNYTLRATLYSDTANKDAALRSIRISYNSPSYARTY